MHHRAEKSPNFSGWTHHVYTVSSTDSSQWFPHIFVEISGFTADSTQKKRHFFGVRHGSPVENSGFSCLGTELVDHLHMNHGILEPILAFKHVEEGLWRSSIQCLTKKVLPFRNCFLVALFNGLSFERILWGFVVNNVSMYRQRRILCAEAQTHQPHRSETPPAPLVTFVVSHSDPSFSGWWFGTWILFFHILGMSSSQLTNSIIFQRG